MKKVLITGVNSYVGNKFTEWMDNYPGEVDIDKVSMRDNKWRSMDFSVYDSILHVAGIAHRKETQKNKGLYFKVNRDITYEIASKARKDGVNQFVFLSTMSIYGMITGEIGKKTIPNPSTFYGLSKLEAERDIFSLNNDKFKIAILRPPMIYGRNCPGNYTKLKRLVLKVPVFPAIENKRSMIYIENLSEFIKQIIFKEKSGFFMPQNNEYVSTFDLVKQISIHNSHKIYFTSSFNKILINLPINSIKKLFGNLVYSIDLSEENIKYNIYNFEESIELTEKDN